MIAGLVLAALLQTPPPGESTPTPTPPPVPAPAVTTEARKLVVGGQFRLRFEIRDPRGYDTAANARENEDLLLSRLRVDLTYSVTGDLDVFAQAQDSRAFGMEASTTSNEKNIDLHQGWVEARDLLELPLAVKAGRQEVSYGDQRLVSPLDWSNAGRSFDGLKARWNGEGWWVDAFYFLVKDGAAGVEDDQDFFGLYGRYAGLADHEFDVYAMRRWLGNGVFTDELGNPGDVRDLTAGARLKGSLGGLDYTLEGAHQTGDYVESRIKAHGLAATAGYTLDIGWKPRVGGEVTWGSGDRDPADGRRGTFDPLFPFGHSYQGFQDIFGWRNGRDVVLRLKASPAENLSLHADLHAFHLTAKEDAWYDAAGAAIRRDATGSSSAQVGSEIDLHARYAAGKAVKFWGGFSFFRAGDFVEETGRHPDMAWAFLQMVVDF